MLARIFNTKPVHVLLSSIILMITCLCVFTPNYLVLKWGANYTVHIMLAYLVLGLLFLVLKQPKLTFTSFACCVGLCFFLKNSSNTDIVYPKASGAPTVNIAHFNLSVSNEDATEMMATIKATDSDLLSIQEITPDWEIVLEEAFKASYPYSCKVYRPEDFMGLMIYSRYPFEEVDTFYYNDIPNLAVSVRGDKERLHFISSYIYPELRSADYIRTEGHFDAIATYANRLREPVILLGDFNQVQWSSYVTKFRRSIDLQDSRRFPFFDNPTDHIFYSNHFECIDFKNINNVHAHRLGIEGIYQINQDFFNVQRTARKF